MPIEVNDAAGPPPPPLSLGGRPAVYPYATMDVGQFFFIAGKTVNNITSHASNRGRELGRRFATRLQWMRRVDGRWVNATEGEPGAVKGVSVYRME